MSKKFNSISQEEDFEYFEVIKKREKGKKSKDPTKTRDLLRKIKREQKKRDISD